MNGLILLWLVSLGIAGAAMVILIVLIVARVFMARTGRTREKRRRRLIPILLGARAPGAAARSVGGDLLAELSVELIQLVRGRDRERFVEAATKMGVPERVRYQLGSGSTRVRLAAAEALAEFPDEATVNALSAALDDRNATVRLTAALSLAALRRAPPARELVDRLGIGRSENSLLLVALMREIAADKPDEVRQLILDPSVPTGAKAAAIDALSASGDLTLVPLVTTLAATADVRDASIPRYLAALGRFGHPAAEPAVKRGLGSPSSETRAAAAEAAGKIGLLGLAPQLKALLGDPIWSVRFRAAEALARLGDIGADLLRDAAEQSPEPARTAASATLAERGLA